MKIILTIMLIIGLAGCGDPGKNYNAAGQFAKLCKGHPTTYEYRQTAWRWGWEIKVSCQVKGE